jgi:cytochrome bd ubiquinol oxidase subunit II
LRFLGPRILQRIGRRHVRTWRRAFVQGFPVRDGQFAGTSFAFLTPFSVLTGIALMFGYGLLGAGWLILKTEGDIQAAARRQGRICLIGVVTAIAISGHQS